MKDMNDIAFLFESPQHLRNLAANFRTLEVLGWNHCFVHDPNQVLDREWSKELQRKWNKASAGAVSKMTWEFVQEPNDWIQKWPGRVIITSWSERAVELDAFVPQPGDLIVFGAEACGVPDRWLQEADEILMIPGTGRTQSLNVAVAAGIVLYHLASHVRKWK